MLDPTDASTTAVVVLQSPFKMQTWKKGLRIARIVTECNVLEVKVKAGWPNDHHSWRAVWMIIVEKLHMQHGDGVVLLIPWTLFDRHGDISSQLAVLNNHVG